MELHHRPVEVLSNCHFLSLLCMRHGKAVGHFDRAAVSTTHERSDDTAGSFLSPRVVIQNMEEDEWVDEHFRHGRAWILFKKERRRSLCPPRHAGSRRVGKM